MHPRADPIVVMGVVIGGIVVAMYLPMFDMINAVHRRREPLASRHIKGHEEHVGSS